MRSTRASACGSSATFDNIIIRLAAPGALLGVHASMEDSEKQAVMKLAKGNEVALDCTGGPMVIGTPTVDDCKIVPPEKYKKK